MSWAGGQCRKESISRTLKFQIPRVLADAIISKRVQFLRGAKLISRKDAGVCDFVRALSLSLAVRARFMAGRMAKEINFA